MMKVIGNSIELGSRGDIDTYFRPWLSTTTSNKVQPADLQAHGSVKRFGLARQRAPSSKGVVETICCPKNDHVETRRLNHMHTI